MRELIQARLKRFEELEQLLADPAVAANAKQVRGYAKEHSRLKPVVERCRELQHLEEQLRQAQELLSSGESQEEMRALAQAEMDELNARRTALERELELMLIEEDPVDEKSAIVEIRAGTGGGEASLFAADLYRMYTRYAANLSWKVESLSMNATEVGGFKEAIFAIEGTGVFRRLKFESGVHRVQRVPAT